MSIKVENLTKFYGQQCAVNNISFEINTGEIVGFLGPNGAGKSTTLKMITTYLSPSSGNVSIDGLSIDEHSEKVRSKIGYLPETNPLYLEMNVVDYLEYAAQLQSVPKDSIKSSINKMISICGLSEVQHKNIGELSKGFKQRVGLAQAMIHNPEVLLLDEPTSGLDPNQILEIRKLIKNLGKQKTLMLSTHILQEVQATCDRVLIINNGEIVADAKTEDLQKKFQGQFVINLSVKKDASLTKDKYIKELQTVKNVEAVRVLSDSEGIWETEVTTSKSGDIREELARKIMSLNLVMFELHQKEISLEEIFRNLTT
jgi:ABC-2 type transport system ATP-binding protein